MTMSLTATTTNLCEAAHKPHANPRDALFAALQGKEAHIPNLKPTLYGWRGVDIRYVSPHLDAVRVKVDERLRNLGYTGKKLRALCGTDFALFAALWWPDASPEKLEVLAALSLWLFTWDDEIDEVTALYTNDFLAAQQYRDDTLRYVRQCLGLATKEDENKPPTRNKIIRSFDVIGHALCHEYDAAQKTRFYDEIIRFISSTELEQRGRLEGVVPDLAEFWNFRLGTSAVYVACAVGEYAIDATRSAGSPLPTRLMESAARQSIWDETNVIISLQNDLVSLKKEMKVGGIDNFVPLVYVCTGDVQQAIELSMHALQTSRERFEAAAQQLLALSSEENDELMLSVHAYIEVMRSNCVGNLNWSLQTGRYMLEESLQADGSYKFTL